MERIEVVNRLSDAMRFASRENFRHLERIRGLEKMILTLAGQLQNLSSDRDSAEVASWISELFTGFDCGDLNRKVDCLEKGTMLVGILHKFDSKKSDARVDRSLPVVSTQAAINHLAGLCAPVTEIKGVGPRIEALLEKKGVKTIKDLFYFFPRAYEDRRKITPIAQAATGQISTVTAIVRGSGLKWYGRKKIFEVTVDDGTGFLKLKWFKGNERYLRTLLATGKKAVLTGEVRGWNQLKEMIHPDFEILDDAEPGESGSLNFGRIVPIYSETEGLAQKRIRRIIKEAFDRFGCHIFDTLPESLRRRNHLQTMEESLREIHFPEDGSDLDALIGFKSDAIRTVIFEEFFFFELGMALRRSGNLKKAGIALAETGDMVKKFHASLPFQLTGAQAGVCREILADMGRNQPMNRLLLGDVGCGKTVVAMTAMLRACENGYQCAMMAPTEILAEQHERKISSWASRMGLKTALLTGKTNSTERNQIYKLIETGTVQIVVGTHALIQEKSIFKSLGLAVVDEQHRFGVVQRAALRQKGANPDVLFMTATPIPRTLAMTVYGDLDISTIDEMPPGKKEIRTKVFYENSRNKVYEIIRKEVKKGNQVFIVYPLATESEVLDLKDATRMSERLKREIFPKFSIEMIHGKMGAAKKNLLMQDFAAGKIQILVATTVIEVGIDIPSASLMVIEHAERFGLSQLHQLRGRVGRSDIPSRCILLTGASRSEAAARRLRIMEETNDGFRIAEADLEIRGPGEFLGTRQSGMPDFKVGHVVRDSRILNEARREAFEIVEFDPDLSREENALMREVLLSRWGGKIKFLEAG